jgi:hypothetical protein
LLKIGREGNDVLRYAASGSSAGEYATYVFSHFLLMSPGPATPALERFPEVRQALQSMSRGELGEALRALSQAHVRARGSDRAYLALVCSSLELKRGSVDRPVDWYLDALGSALSEDDNVWWATYAGVLGICMIAAKCPPANWRPFSETKEGIPHDLLLELLGTCAAWMRKGETEENQRSAQFRVMFLAAAAIYGAVAPPLVRAAAGRSRDVALLEAQSHGLEGYMRMAEDVDDAIGGDWSFAPWIADLAKQWSAMANGLNG